MPILWGSEPFVQLTAMMHEVKSLKYEVVWLRIHQSSGNIQKY